MCSICLFAIKGVGHSTFNSPVQGTGTHTSLLPLGKYFIFASCGAKCLILQTFFLLLLDVASCGGISTGFLLVNDGDCVKKVLDNNQCIAIQKLICYEGKESLPYSPIHTTITMYPNNSFPNQLMFTALETKICETDSPPSDWRNLSSCLWFSFATFIGESVMR